MAKIANLSGIWGSQKLGFLEFVLNVGKLGFVLKCGKKFGWGFMAKLGSPKRIWGVFKIGVFWGPSKMWAKMVCSKMWGNLSLGVYGQIRGPLRGFGGSQNLGFFGVLLKCGQKRFVLKCGEIFGWGFMAKIANLSGIWGSSKSGIFWSLF